MFFKPQNRLKKEQITTAQEALHIFAPLANRLGIGQLKWELEDLAFRTCMDTYQNIARLLDQKRVHREQYIHLLCIDA